MLFLLGLQHPTQIHMPVHILKHMYVLCLDIAQLPLELGTRIYHAEHILVAMAMALGPCTFASDARLQGWLWTFAPGYERL